MMMMMIIGVMMRGLKHKIGGEEIHSDARSHDLT